MSFYIANGLLTGDAPLPEKRKDGVVSFAYVTATNNTISYLQLLGSNTLWVTGLAAAGTDTLNLPTDAQMIQLFDPNQILVGCSRHISLYVNARCTLAATTPATIVLPVAGMYDLDLTVVSATGVYVSCQQVSGGPEATSGNYIAPLTRSVTGAIPASSLIPPAGSCELVLVSGGVCTLPDAALLYAALYGTQTHSQGMSVAFKFVGSGDALNASASITASAVSPLPGSPVANTVYLVTIMFTTETVARFSGIAIGGIAP